MTTIHTIAATLARSARESREAGERLMATLEQNEANDERRRGELSTACQACIDAVPQANTYED